MASDANEREVAALERRRLDALVNADREGFASMMTDDCVVLHGSGVIERKTEFLRVFDRMTIKSLEQKSVIVRSYGDSTVVVISTTEMRTGPAGENVGGHNQTTVWCRDDAGWRFNTLHNTRLPPPA